MSVRGMTEPEFEVIDSHIHIFSTIDRCKSLNWLHKDHVLYRPHPYSLYQESDSPATKAVFVECDTKIQDDFAAHFREFEDAAAVETIGAIVAWAPMSSLSSMENYLNHILELDSRKLLRGIRVLLQDKPDEYCLGTEFIRCTQLLGSRGLLFEIGIDVHSRGTKQLQDALQLIMLCPKTVFVMNHLAKPDLSQGVNSAYRELMTMIAAMPNVSMKLSGCFTELREDDLPPHPHLQSYIECNVNLFGSDRLLFGSDWPVLNLTTASTNKTPAGWFEYCKKTLQGLGLEQAELRKVFGANVKRIYNMT